MIKVRQKKIFGSNYKFNFKFRRNDKTNDKTNDNKLKFKKIVHVYQLKLKNNKKCSGLGDFFRGSFCLMQLSKILNIEFDIDISNHPISKYIESPNKVKDIDYNDIEYYGKRNEGNDKRMVFNKNLIETNFDKVFINDLVKWLNTKDKKVVGLYTNAFPFINKFTQQGIEFIKSRFVPNIQLINYVESTLKELKLKKKDYDVIHIRTGDKYLLENKKMDTEFINKIKSILKSIIYSNTKYLIISDSNHLKQQIKDIPNLYFVEKEIVHTAVCNNDDGLLNTLLDFFLIGNSNSMISLSVYEWESGFSKYSCVLNNIPSKFIRINDISIEKLKYNIDHKIAFITLTNTGYINYTLNCLKSLENINFNEKLKCYCIGKEGFNILNSKNYDCELIDDENNSNFQVFRNGNWSNITFNKFRIIYENLLIYDYVCITDGDIVFENPNVLKTLKEDILDNDMLIQNDKLTDNDNSLLCSGFMFLKSNEATKKFFNPLNVENEKNKLGWDDQIYMNDNKNKLKYKVLPLHLFPNGKYFYENNEMINPYIIHFNWVIGSEKQKKMDYYKKWYLK